MGEILGSLAISAGILLPVVILVVMASMAAVKRGEAPTHSLEAAAEPGALETDSVAGKEPRASFLPNRDPSVLEILLLAVAIFILTMGLLLAFSAMQQLR